MLSLLFASSFWLTASPLTPHVQRGPEDIQQASAQAQEAWPYSTEIWELLLPPNRGKEASPEVIGIKIAKLGPQAIGTVVGIFCGTIPEPEFSHDVEPSAINRRPAILLAAVRKFPALEVLKVVKQQLSTSSPALDTRVAMARLLGEVHSEAVCDVMILLYDGLDDANLARDYVRSTFVESLAGVIQREPKAIRRLEMHIEDGLRPALAGPVARGLGDSHDERAIAPLAQLIGRSAFDDRAILASIVDLARLSTATPSMTTIGRLQYARSGNPDPVVRGTAAIALAALGDLGSIPSMIEMLGDPDPHIAAAGAKALREISREAAGRDAAGWHRWLVSETAWWETEAIGWVERLPELRADDVIAASGDLLRHPIYRHQLATIVVELLDRESPEVRKAALELLRRLDSPRCAPMLVAYLDAPDEELRAKVHELLTELTNRTLPAETGAWRAALSM